ncbi:hypothetical protein G4G28_16465 [Massilia sp. Dwa41.01b]|uniref:hypothetical protein n=1 Tax=unclassified Massilia TaxID=2609279 RepID=UPI0016049998|nr:MULTISPECIES: hypothetical protein [unclassified Massilia]QNA89663.1 hypothetical protein G4G28_16465 [Massilia sp. Dwa41.01b]QNB00559.1 hypothetical protein G4G31_20045 [Massilia sp. Se16.2.3]
MNKSFQLSAACKLVLMAGMVSALAACGGGGGDSAPPPVVVVPPPPVVVVPPPTVSYAITMSGTAATGAAIAGATVTATCKTGTATAVTGTDGSYTVKVAVPGEGPCILSLTQNGVTLRSIAAGDGAKANITPLTEMFVAYISTSSGAGVAATPTQLAQNANVRVIVGNATMMTATANRVVQLVSTAAGGVSVPNDFLSATLVPKSATNPGNAQDAVLEALKTAKVVGANGAPIATLLESVRKDASENILTGGTGGTTGGSGG